mgnify:CR=1 FL=1|jgi:hypothetical protein
MMANQAQQDQAVGIRYVGVRDLHEDHLYGTRLAWLPGQVHNVDAAIAVRMLMHKDVYERADVEANKPVSGKSNQVEQEQERVQEQQLDDTRSAIAIMDKDALEQFAKTHFQIDLDKRKGLSNLRSQVIGLIDQFGMQ